jgi:tartrate/fumarate subfamily iron-sulfur-dependent hydro-lyase alpha chain
LLAHKRRPNHAATSISTWSARTPKASIGKHLPNDVKDKLAELRTLETNPLAKAIYDSMAENQEAADKLDRPSCQDTGVIQYFIKAGAKFPLLGELEYILREVTLGATKMGPLRHNAVETFDEKNTGSKIPWLDWEIVPDDDTAVIDVYMAGGGCTLPGKVTVLMPWQGYEGVTDFVFDRHHLAGRERLPAAAGGSRGVHLGGDGHAPLQAGDPAAGQFPERQPQCGEDG